MLANTRLLLVLAPWPATNHYSDAEKADAQHFPANAVANPICPTDTVARHEHAEPFDL